MNPTDTKRNDTKPTRMKPTPGGWYVHPFEIAVTGYSGAGKTTLCERLIARMTDSGRSVAYLKRDAHRFSMDTPGKDTWRASEAGASVVGVEDRTHAAILAAHGPKGASAALVQQAAAPADAVVIEGRKHSPIPKLLLLDPRSEIDADVDAGRLSAVVAVIHPAGEEDRARRLAAAVPGVDGAAPAVCSRDDVDGALEIVNAYWRRLVAPLSGVVLVGGHSTRMGRDKGAIADHEGRSAARRTVDLLRTVCGEVFVSARAGQELPADVAAVPRIDDRFLGMGPAGGILSALYHDSRRAWLVVSCDLPLLAAEDLQFLVAERDPMRLATSLAVPAEPGDGGPHSDGGPHGDGGPRDRGHHDDREEELLPEPLCAIWEPRSRGRILSFFQEGATCPRWMLRNGGVRMVEAPGPYATFNANTPEELDRARELAAGATERETSDRVVSTPRSPREATR